MTFGASTAMSMGRMTTLGSDAFWAEAASKLSLQMEQRLLVNGKTFIGLRFPGSASTASARTGKRTTEKQTLVEKGFREDEDGDYQEKPVSKL
jgi:hypothetical protein